jgi:hypothetical protein
VSAPWDRLPEIVITPTPIDYGLDDKLKVPDLTPVKVAFGAALAALLLRWGPIKQAWTEQLTSQVQYLADDNTPQGFASMGVDSTQGAAVLADALAAYAPIAANHVVAEAQAQGATPPPPPQVQPTGQLTVQAEVTAALLAAGLALSAGSEAQRVHRDGRPGRDTAADVRAYLDGLSDAAPRNQLGYALHTAELGARLATLLYSTGVKLYSAELMDNHLCVPCREIDGTLLAVSGGDMSKLHMLYPNGGYIGCKGGINCRGTVIGIWPKEGE